jgi:P27 family predicted phage terminase small subunit
MVRGPKPKPTEAKRLAGNPGKRKLTNSPRPASSLPIAPDGLSSAEIQIWNERAAALSPVGMLTDADRAIVKRSCQVSGIADQLHAQLLAKPGRDVPGLYEIDHTESGTPFLVGAPYLTQFRQYVNLERLILAELGMTPSSRSRVLPGEADLDTDLIRERRAATPFSRKTAKVVTGGKT